MTSDNLSPSPQAPPSPNPGRRVVGSLANLSLRLKLILAFLAVTVISVGVVTLVVNRVIRIGLTDQVGRNLDSLAEVKAQQIAETLDQQIKVLESFTYSRALRQQIFANGARRTGDSAAIQDQLQQLDNQWDVAADTDFLIQNLLNKPFSQELKELRARLPGFVDLFLTNQHGELIGATQRADSYYFAGKPWWQATYNDGWGASYIGQPEFYNSISSFGIIVAIPIRSPFDPSVIGVLHGTYSLEALTQGLASARFGQTGNADLLLPNGEILSSDGRLASVEPQLIEQLELLANQPYAQLHLQERDSLVSLAPLVAAEGDARAIQALGWTLIVDQAAAEALAPVDQATRTALYTSLGVLTLAGVLAFLVARVLVAPIVRLTEVSARIAAGDRSIQAPVESGDEIGRLATTFNVMTGQIRQTLEDLERYSQVLVTSADVSRQLSTILDQKQLVNEVVDQIRQTFKYYHVQIYLLDPTGQNLVLAAATGEAGEQLLARRHKLSLDQGLVGHAATTHAIVLAPDTAAEPQWLPNPLLPATKAEVALPISLGEQVLGVLDVQEDKINGLGESDANLLRSLASQVAVALRNARQFAEVERALYEARAQQERYLERAWDKHRVVQQNAGQARFSLIETPLDDQIVEQAGRYARDYSGPTVVALPAGEGTEASTALVAPLTVQKNVIGDLQLYPANPQRQWTESELALINTVLDEVAQVAENLRLFEETRERAGYERLVRETTQKIRQAPTLEALTQIASESLGQILGVSGGTVSLYTRSPQTSSGRPSTRNGGQPDGR